MKQELSRNKNRKSSLTSVVRKAFALTGILLGTFTSLWFGSKIGLYANFYHEHGVIDEFDDGTPVIRNGSMNAPSDLPDDATTLVKHIFMADKGAYYDVADGLPQSDGW